MTFDKTTVAMVSLSFFLMGSTPLIRLIAKKQEPCVTPTSGASTGFPSRTWAAFLCTWLRSLPCLPLEPEKTPPFRRGPRRSSDPYSRPRRRPLAAKTLAETHRPVPSQQE